MFKDIENVGNYRIIINSYPIAKLITHSFAAKVTHINRALDGAEIEITPELTFLSWGITEKEAYDTCLSRAKNAM